MERTEHDSLFISGEWVPPVGSSTIEVTNSTTEDVMGVVPAGTTADVDRAVRAARAAFPAWSALSVEERGRHLEALADQLQKRVAPLARMFSEEVGFPIGTAENSQQTSAEVFRLYARIAKEYAWQTRVGATDVVKEPIGVVGAITPWNVPLLMIAAKVAPALAAGCTVVVKPAEVAPLTAFVLAEAVAAAGLPAGVFNLVSGSGAEAGEALVAHPDVDMISFTGSTRAGRRISAVGGETVKRLSLELGGKSAMLVLDDADLEQSVGTAMASIMMGNGQGCSLLSRLVVPRARVAEAEEIAAELVDKLVVGDPLDRSTTLGPMASRQHQQRVSGYLETGIGEGARVVRGGPGMPEGLERGYFIRPTVFSTEDPAARIAQEEIFGPVQVILPHDGDDHAVEIANNTIYGLAGAVFSTDTDRAVSVARRVRAGQVDVNCINFDLSAPFGGYRQSGNGRTWGVEGFEEYLEIKSLTVAGSA
jgi:acyl-CoA reductase-like NAD-dependent aldehyde dehydrogenase